MKSPVQPLRYALVGGLTTVTYLALTLLFAGPLQLPIQVAMICGYTIALAVHFSGQRMFVFRTAEGFALATDHQARRYLLIGGAQIGLTLLITTFVPGLIGVDERIVYAVATVALAAASYLMLRFHVFHAHRPPLAAQGSG
jgi:putative flippase GtrA